jgi:hypothetical protein
MAAVTYVAGGVAGDHVAFAVAEMPEAEFWTLGVGVV